MRMEWNLLQSGQGADFGVFSQEETVTPSSVSNACLLFSKPSDLIAYRSLLSKD